MLLLHDWFISLQMEHIHVGSRVYGLAPAGLAVLGVDEITVSRVFCLCVLVGIVVVVGAARPRAVING